MATKVISLKKELRSLAAILELYKKQLLARHDNEPQKSPPLFLLNNVITRLEQLAEKVKNATTPR